MIKCSRENGGQPPPASRGGAGCYVFFPSDQTFEVQPPPEQDLADAQLVLAKKELRTPATVQDIRSQAVDPMPLFWKASGIDKAHNPRLAEMVRMALNDGENLTLKIKAEFERTRPHVVLPEIEPVVEVPWHSSYPSGHATQAVLAARILSCANPLAKHALNELAIQVGKNREVAGVHYPSDTKAGFLLGMQIFEELVKNPSFSCELDRPDGQKSSNQSQRNPLKRATHASHVR